MLPLLSLLMVDIQDMKFNPETVQARVGDTIVWTNRDIVPHTVSGKGLESGVINGGASFRYKVKKAGTTEYRCKFHPTMSGHVRVTKASEQ